MRRHWQLGVAAALAMAGAAPLVAGTGDEAKGKEVMAAVRKALGGENKLAGLKSLSVRADFRRETATPFAGGGTIVIMSGGGGRADAGGQTTGSIEIDLLLPDRFYRSESSSGGFSITRIDGFEGTRPFLDLLSNSPGTRVAADRPSDSPDRAAAMLRRLNTDLARLLLGMTGGAQPGLAAKYSYVGRAESPDGTAHVIDVTGEYDFKARLFVDTATHLPLMLTYSEPEARPVRMTMNSHGGAPPARPAGEAGAAGSSERRVTGSGRPPVADMSQLTPEQRAEIEKQVAAAQAEPPKMVDYRLFFADYREVSGISLPHRISRATAEKTVEEWEVKDYRVNPSIKLDRFKVGA